MSKWTAIVKDADDYKLVIFEMPDEWDPSEGSMPSFPEYGKVLFVVEDGQGASVYDRHGEELSRNYQ